MPRSTQRVAEGAKALAPKDLKIEVGQFSRKQTSPQPPVWRSSAESPTLASATTRSDWLATHADGAASGGP